MAETSRKVSHEHTTMLAQLPVKHWWG